MYKYNPPYTITDKILNYVSSISEKIGSITSTMNLNSRPHLRKNNRIQSIHASLKIEANSLSIRQVRDVIDGKIVLGEQKEIQEVKNAYSAYENILNINPYSLEELLKYHGIMTKYLIQESGVFRSGEEGVFKGEYCIFMAPPAKFVTQQMSDLFEWMNEHYNDIHPLILSSVFHYEFVFIHPFSNGNGRMARLWHTVLLTKWKSIFEYIPLESQIEKFQEQYYDVIDECHKMGSSTLFIEFMLEQIDCILDNISIDKYGYNEYINRLLKVMEYAVPYSTYDLMKILKLKSREGFRRNYLKPALESNLIEMTIPDKPHSKNQKYIKV